MANHRMYRYTSIGRPLDPGYPTNKAVLMLLPLAAALGAAAAFMEGQSVVETAGNALNFLLAAFGAWALARELDPDDQVAAFIAMAFGVLAALIVDSPGILIVFATLGLVRIVNRSTGLEARKSDSLVVMLLVFAVIYLTESPLFGTVAALAFVLDGSLKSPSPHQWFFGLICFGGTVVYLVDHDLGLSIVSVPDSLFEWLSLLFLMIFGLNTLLMKRVASTGDFGASRLDLSRVRGGMTVGLLAALQGLIVPENVVIIVASIAGICIGMAFRKGFKAPAAGVG
ncbi:MAG: hypothetical protein HKP16_00740 [Xanthomonadales bacterium]|nr:hypothetical protein [Gammaproteobacteria bacterium]NNJ64064.1 hypothetical protein [Xanthomonadales bacterium]